MDDLWEWALIIAAVSVMIAWEHFSFKNQKRMWMWVAGLAGISLLVWFKGPEHTWTWLLALGWLGVLVYGDRKLTGQL